MSTVNNILIVQASPMGTGSTLLTNILYGLILPDQPVSYQSLQEDTLILKTHTLDFDKLTQDLGEGRRIYFVSSERKENHLFINQKYKPWENVCVLNYGDLLEREDYSVEQIVDTVYDKLIDFLPKEIGLNKETAVHRVNDMNRKYEEIKHNPFSYFDTFYHIHGSHRDRSLQPSISESEKPPRRLIVTASIDQRWNSHCEASVRHWANRVGAELCIRTEPYIIDGQICHPWFSKWDILADVVEARQPEEVVWLGNTIVIRADTGWPEYREWAAYEIAGSRDLGDCIQKNGALEASRLTGIPWNCSDGYYNTSVFFRRNPSASEFRELGMLTRKIPLSLLPHQAALAVHLARRTGIRHLPLSWNVRGPDAPDGYLPGYINNFLGGKWALINRLGPLWTKVPGSAVDAEVTNRDITAWRQLVSQSVQLAIDAIDIDDPMLARGVLAATRERLNAFNDKG